jgi:HAD superfamily hydrolase (TIGR01549 family)
LIAILDIDGTLVDTNYHHAIGWYRAFRRLDTTVPLVDLHRHMGMGGDQLVPDVAGEDFEREHGDEVRDLEKEEYQRLIDEVALLDGAKELIAALRDRDAKVILASSAKEAEVEHYLGLLDVDDLPYTTSADVETTKPAPDLVEAALKKAGAGGDEQAFMLGDSTYDCEAAARAGIPTIGLLTGGFSEEELREAGASFVHRRLPDVMDDLDSLFETATPTGER